MANEKMMMATLMGAATEMHMTLNCGCDLTWVRQALGRIDGPQTIELAPITPARCAYHLEHTGWKDFNGPAEDAPPNESIYMIACEIEDAENAIRAREG